jgi:hypothetical protein
VVGTGWLAAAPLKHLCLPERGCPTLQVQAGSVPKVTGRCAAADCWTGHCSNVGSWAFIWPACSVLIVAATHLDSSCQGCQARPHVFMSEESLTPVFVGDCLGSACRVISLDGGTDCLMSQQHDSTTWLPPKPALLHHVVHGAQYMLP